MKIPFVLSAIAFLFLCGCQSGDTGTAAGPCAEKLSQATEVKIVFNSGEKHSLTRPEDLATAAKVISAEETPAYKCGFDGSISYVKGEEGLLSAEFKLSDDCRHVAVADGENLKTYRISEEGLVFLRGLQEKTPKTNVQLSELSWILGKWKQEEGPATISFEEWAKEDDRRFTGRAFTIHEGDTAFTEALELVQLKEGIFYIPTIPSNEGPVRFKLTSADLNSAVFENPTHDFPQTIAYKLLGDSLHARISGTAPDLNGQPKFGFKDFYMSRVQ